jgi:hypothetical protein
VHLTVKMTLNNITVLNHNVLTSLKYAQQVNLFSFRALKAPTITPSINSYPFEKLSSLFPSLNFIVIFSQEPNKIDYFSKIYKQSENYEIFLMKHSKRNILNDPKYYHFQSYNAGEKRGKPKLYNLWKLRLHERYSLEINRSRYLRLLSLLAHPIHYLLYPEIKFSKLEKLHD